MLTFRREHIAAFQEVTRKEFEKILIEELREKHPERFQDKPEEHIREFARYGVEHAAMYKIDREDDVRRYVDLMVKHGKDFDTNPRTGWAGQVLRTPSMTAPQKLDGVDRIAAQIAAQG